MKKFYECELCGKWEESLHDVEVISYVDDREEEKIYHICNDCLDGKKRVRKPIQHTSYVEDIEERPVKKRGGLGFGEMVEIP